VDNKLFTLIRAFFLKQKVTRNDKRKDVYYNGDANMKHKPIRYISANRYTWWPKKVSHYQMVEKSY